MPQVSVIMPVYNMAKSGGVLETAIGSIIKQTYQDWELIICDDGSTDDTLQVLQKLAQEDERIRIFHSPKNRKAANARNICIRAARGRYIAVMDADDIAAPKRLEIQKAFLDHHPEYALVGSNAWMIDSRGIWGMRRMEEKPGRESFLSTLPFVHSSIILRKEAVLALRGYSQTRFLYRMEDYEFLMRLYAEGYRGYNIQQPLLHYREDMSAYRKRKYRYRILECRMRYRGFQNLGILCGNLRYVVKPLAAGLVPSFLMRAARHRRFRMMPAGKKVFDR